MDVKLEENSFKLSSENISILKDLYKKEKYYLQSFYFFQNKIDLIKNNRGIGSKTRKYKIRKQQINFNIRRRQYRRLIEQICYFYSRVNPKDYKDSMVLSYTNLLGISLFNYYLQGEI